MLLVSNISKLISNQVLLNLRNGYKSSISLDKLYPKSSNALNSLASPELKVDSETFSGYIPIENVQINFKTSSKPGGQHVNKTQTCVEVRFHVDSAEWIPKWIRDKLKENQINRINKEGFLIVKSEKTRKTMLNQADCFEQIRSMIYQASFKPKGLDESELMKIEIDKKIADGKRMVQKRKQSESKSQRRHPVYDAITDYY